MLTYEDPERKIEFGAVFAFALGGNPEILIALEKYSEGMSCELVRIGGAEMHVQWRGRGIWISDHGVEKSRENPRHLYMGFMYTDLEAGKLYTEPDTSFQENSHGNNYDGNIKGPDKHKADLCPKEESVLFRARKQVTAGSASLA